MQYRRQAVVKLEKICFLPGELLLIIIATEVKCSSSSFSEHIALFIIGHSLFDGGGVRPPNHIQSLCTACREWLITCFSDQCHRCRHAKNQHRFDQTGKIPLYVTKWAASFCYACLYRPKINGICLWWLPRQQTSPRVLKPSVWIE
jgi:hypothetical protein